MNPPFQRPKKVGVGGGGQPLWNKFVIKAFTEWARDKGFIAAIHPAGWRKPESKTSRCRGLFKLMTRSHLLYLEIHDAKDGKKTFGVGTRYDWYVAQKGITGTTEVCDEQGNHSTITLKDYPWIPNHSMDEVAKLLGEDGEVIYSRSAYRQPQPWVSAEQTKDFRYPLVHTTPKKGVRWCYSSRNDNGLFGVSKVIFGDSGINHVIIDTDGEFGMTEHSMALPVVDETDALKAKEFLLGDEFRNVVDACSWSNFQIEWRMFRDFRKGFWR